MARALRQDVAVRATQPATGGPHARSSVPAVLNRPRRTCAPPTELDFARLRCCTIMKKSARAELSNDIAQTVRSYKPQTVVCRLYGKRDCLLTSLHATAAALRPGNRSPT